TEIPASRTENNGTQQRGRGNAEVRKLDKDASGAVEGYEWPYNSATFHRLDTDNNSVLTADELRNLSSVSSTELNQKPGDSNQWSGTYADLDRLDANRDGRVSVEEYTGQGTEYQRRQRFDGWDTNRNGVIDSTEWKVAPRLF